MKKNIKFIIKRNSKKVEFKTKKITKAIAKAFMQTTISNKDKAWEEAKRLTPIATDLFSKQVNGETPSVEMMQDVVEQVLMAAGHYQTAKHYIIYRVEHTKQRAEKNVIGVKDDLGLSVNQLKVIENRYLRHDEEGNTIETPRQMFKRVAKAVAVNEKTDTKKWQKKFEEIMLNFEFLPAGCYLRGAGTKRQMLANCFVLPVDDSMEGIFNGVKWMAMVHQKGGGTGFNFSSLRPKGDYVVSSGGYSSGPISFMKVFDAATRQVMQGGFKRGANMGILNIDHPDIFDFITCKTEEDEITNFNISIGITDDFMQAVEADEDFHLKNPRNGETVQTIRARNLFSQIVTLAWRTGDPGLIFLDAINRHNPLIDTLGPMTATNPCGEQPLHPFDVCNLGSINLAKFVDKNQNADDLLSTNMNNPKSSLIKWSHLEYVTRLAVRFLDNGVDVSNYPVDKIQQTAQANRRIGLGVMGWADMLYQLGISYNSEEGSTLAEKVMGFINTITHDESVNLAEEKGNFKNWKGSTYDKKDINHRNVAITTIAPTGTISMAAEASSGIEPVFALSFTKNVVDNRGLLYVNPFFKKALAKAIPDKNKREILLEEVSKTGSCQHVDGIPEEIKKIYVTAHDVSPQSHVRMQAAFQKYTDNAVSKTINFPNEATINEVEEAYLSAWRQGCKGITIYRDGSKSFQILESRKPANIESKTSQPLSQKTEKVVKQPLIQSKHNITPLRKKIIKNNGQKTQNSGQETQNNPKHPTLNIQHSNSKEAILFDSKKLTATNQQPQTKSEPCPECGTQLQMTEGCMTCYSCGWSKCSL